MFQALPSRDGGLGRIEGFAQRAGLRLLGLVRRRRGFLFAPRRPAERVAQDFILALFHTTYNILI